MGISNPKIALTQIVNAVFGIICMVCLAYQLTYNEDPAKALREAYLVFPELKTPDDLKGYWTVYGTSAHGFLFTISSSAVIFGVVSILTPDPDGSIVGSIFFCVLNGVYAVFYLAGSICLFVNLGNHSAITRSIMSVTIPKEPHSYAASAFALFAAMSHTATAVLSKIKERD